MEIRTLKYFLVVCQEENITRAAKILHMTQPTLSRQLHQLEEELNTTLFNRGTHNITLTDDGRFLKHRAEEIINLTEKTKNEFLNDDNIAGEIIVGCAETYNVKYIVECMTNFRKKYPLTSFKIKSGTADFINEQIEQGLIDVGLLMEPVDVKRYEMIRLPYKEQWGIIACDDNKLTRLETIQPTDLLNTPLILPERIMVQSTLKKWFGNIFDELEVAATYNLLMNAMFAVMNNFGVALCYEFDQFFPGTKFVPLNNMEKFNAVLIWKKQKSFSKTVQKFLELCSKSIS